MAHNDPDPGDIITSSRYVDLDSQGTYVPVLTAHVENPSLGVDSLQDGWWHRNGHFIEGGAIVRFGVSSAVRGSGIYTISLPFDADLSIMTAGGGIGLVSCVGSCIIRDNNPATGYAGSLYLVDANHVRMATPGNVQDDSPFTFSASDSFSISFSYLADSNDLP